MSGELITKIQNYLSQHSIDALVVASPSNVTYIAGYEVPSQIFPVIHRLVFCVVTPSNDALMIIPNMEASMARSDSRLSHIHEYNEFTQDPIEVLANVLKKRGVDRGRIAIEDNFIPGCYLKNFYELLPNAEIVPSKPVTTKLRLIKTEEEIEILKKVNKIAERAQIYISENAAQGMSELQIAQLISEFVLSHGVDRVNKTIVGSGERSEHPNANPTSRIINKGDIVRTDVLIKLKGYQSDIANTFIVGSPNKRQLDIWSDLIQARELLLSMIHPFASTKNIYRAYLDFFNKKGYPPTDFVGHGIGINLHEAPYISRFHDVELEPRMILAIEPMIFLPGEGFQIEDDVVVTESGYELITNYRDPSNIFKISS